MIGSPKTKAEARKYRYNKWAGDPEGTGFDELRCAYQVHERGRGCMFYQCLRKPGHGPDGLYCRTHANKVLQKGNNL